MRYSYVSGVLTPTPIALPANPDSFELNPGIGQQDVTQTSCTGENQIILSYITESKPEISISFGLGTPEIESLIINRVAKAGTNYAGWVYWSAVATSTSVAGKASGKYGNSVTAQSASTTDAQAYYISPLTKLAVPLTIVDSSPVGDQIVIGANLALTLSQELVDDEVNIYGWVPATFANVTYMSSETIPMIGVYAIGICFDETVKLFNARRCSFMPGGAFTKDPKRDIKLRVLADGQARTGLGYDIVQLRDGIACGQ